MKRLARLQITAEAGIFRPPAHAEPPLVKLRIGTDTFTMRREEAIALAGALVAAVDALEGGSCQLAGTGRQ